MKKQLIKTFEKIPIFGGLASCDYEDFTSAVKELLSTLMIALSPIWLSVLFLLIKADGSPDYITIIKHSMWNGELMIYCTALLAPVFYITSSDTKYSIGALPNKLSSVIISILILIVTVVVYTLQKSGSSYNHDTIFYLSIILFFFSLLILFANKVYNNNRLATTYMDLAQQEEKDFSSQLRKHRKRK